MKYWVEENGREISISIPKSARCTFAAIQLRTGRDLVHIAAILGHKSVSTTRRLEEDVPVRPVEIVARAV